MQYRSFNLLRVKSPKLSAVQSAKPNSVKTEDLFFSPMSNVVDKLQQKYRLRSKSLTQTAARIPKKIYKTRGHMVPLPHHFLPWGHSKSASGSLNNYYKEEILDCDVAAQVLDSTAMDMVDSQDGPDNADEKDCTDVIDDSHELIDLETQSDAILHARYVDVGAACGDTEVIGNDRDIDELAMREEGDIFDGGGMITECVEDTELDQEYYYDDMVVVWVHCEHER